MSFLLLLTLFLLLAPAVDSRNAFKKAFNRLFTPKFFGQVASTVLFATLLPGASVPLLQRVALQVVRKAVVEAVQKHIAVADPLFILWAVQSGQFPVLEGVAAKAANDALTRMAQSLGVSMADESSLDAFFAHRYAGDKLAEMFDESVDSIVEGAAKHYEPSANQKQAAQEFELEYQPSHDEL